MRAVESTNRQTSFARRLDVRKVGASCVVIAALCAAAFPAGARAEAPEAERVVGSCTPELVYTFTPGEVDAAGAGTGVIDQLFLTDADGSHPRLTSGTLTWSARAIVRSPGSTGARPRIGGLLDLVITTAEGERIAYTATCVAGSGAHRFGMVLYTNGLARGWPGTSAPVRSLVHFEGITDGTTYVALVAGADCALDFSRLVVTDGDAAVGTNTFTGLPDRFRYSETDCARRFGDPFPATLAPGLQG